MDMEETKRCRDCEQEKPITDFYKSDKGQCKDCKLRYNRERDKKMREARKRKGKLGEIGRTNEHKYDELIYKKCSGCEQEKVLEAFGTTKKRQIC